MPIKPTELTSLIEQVNDGTALVRGGRVYLDAEWFLKQLGALTDPPFLVHVEPSRIHWCAIGETFTIDQAVAVLEERQLRQELRLLEQEALVKRLEAKVGREAP